MITKGKEILKNKKGESAVEVVVLLSVVLVIATALFSFQSSILGFLGQSRNTVVNLNDYTDNQTYSNSSEMYNDYTIANSNENINSNIQVSTAEEKPVKEEVVKEKNTEVKSEKEPNKIIGFFKSLTTSVLSDVIAGILVAIVTWKVQKSVSKKIRNNRLDMDKD